MSREALDRAYKLFSRGDKEGFLAMLAPDAVIHASGRMPGMGEDYRGREEHERWWHELRDSWTEFRIEHSVSAVEGNRYLVDVLVRGIGAASGAEVRQQVWHVVELEGTRATRHWSFWNRADAEAVLQERKTERPG